MKLIDICPICYNEPNSHSFDKICEINGVCMLYTKPSAAKNESGSITLLTTEHETSPSFHWSPEIELAIVRYPLMMT